MRASSKAILGGAILLSFFALVQGTTTSSASDSSTGSSSTSTSGSSTSSSSSASASASSTMLTIDSRTWYYLYEGVAYLTVGDGDDHELTTQSEDAGNDAQEFMFPNGIPGIIISRAYSDNFVSVMNDDGGHYTGEGDQDSAVQANYLDDGASLSIYYVRDGKQTTYLSEPCTESYSITSWNFTVAS